jgi:hypothetical protein
MAAGGCSWGRSPGVGATTCWCLRLCSRLQRRNPPMRLSIGGCCPTASAVGHCGAAWHCLPLVEAVAHGMACAVLLLVCVAAPFAMGSSRCTVSTHSNPPGRLHAASGCHCQAGLLVVTSATQGPGSCVSRVCELRYAPLPGWALAVAELWLCMGVPWYHAACNRAAGCCRVW